MTLCYLLASLAHLFIDKHSERWLTFVIYSYSLLIYFWPPSSLVVPLSLHCSDRIGILLYLYIDHSRAFGRVDHVLKKEATTVDLFELLL